MVLGVCFRVCVLTKHTSYCFPLLAELRASLAAVMDKMFSATLQRSGCYCVCRKKTQNQRIPRTQQALFMCYERHDSKEIRKQPCSTFTGSYHVMCEGEEASDETEARGRKES